MSVEPNFQKYFLPEPIPVPDFQGDCRGMPTDWWFPPLRQDRQVKIQIARAREICENCHAKEACLAFAVQYPSLQGIWGGTTPNMRKRLRRKVKVGGNAD
jgi:WhiB family redox-sensing transcriptional regulator